MSAISPAIAAVQAFPHWVSPCGTVLLVNGDCRSSIGEIAADCAIADPPYGDTSLEWDEIVKGWQVSIRAPQLWCFGSFRCFLEDQAAFNGWSLAQEVVWEKHNGSSFHADRFKRVHELAVHFYRGKWSDLYIDPQVTMDATKRTVRRRQRPPHTGHIEAGHYVSEDGGPRMMRSVLRVRSCHGYAVHPTQKPIDIILPLIRYSCPVGGVVLDLFSGSGTVPAACLQAERHCIAFEIDPTYYAIARDRISAALGMEVARPDGTVQKRLWTPKVTP